MSEHDRTKPRVTLFKSIIDTRKYFQEASRSSHYVFKAAHEDML
jgi:hypothetical protein